MLLCYNYDKRLRNVGCSGAFDAEFLQVDVQAHPHQKTGQLKLVQNGLFLISDHPAKHLYKKQIKTDLANNQLPKKIWRIVLNELLLHKFCILKPARQYKIG